MGFSLLDIDLVGMVSSPTSALAVVSHGHTNSRLSILELPMAVDRTSVRTTANRTTMSTMPNNNKTSITVSYSSYSTVYLAFAWFLLCGT
jgi:hypothetical protein